MRPKNSLINSESGDENTRCSRKWKQPVGKLVGKIVITLFLGNVCVCLAFLKSYVQKIQKKCF